MEVRCCFPGVWKVVVNRIRKFASMKLLRALTITALAAQAAALSIGGRHMKVERGSDGLQEIVSSSLKL